MIRYPNRESIEALVKIRLEETGTKLAFLNKSNFLFILDSVRDVSKNVDERISLVNKAAYLIAKTIDLHPLADGNKRLAAILVRFFLAINDQQLVVTQDQFYETLIGFARHDLKETDISTWLDNNLRQI
ncbi:MAG: type II toxin-antitoxin system death-on-curing family toxin [Thaumarchaeota archaeon]|nr:type II toxin-antitoxin system death-on-curing family toxin [Nitrososphaerota archaeon]